jgi:hypothetical protein
LLKISLSNDNGKLAGAIIAWRGGKITIS